MVRLRLSAEARRDLRLIGEAGVRAHGQAAARRYLDGFRRLFGMLREQPFAGQERPEFELGIRSLSHRPYRILYRVTDDMVQIDRIIHQARDAHRALQDLQ